jgi:hypothetical protein
MCQQIVIKLPNTKFYEAPFHSSEIISCMQTDSTILKRGSIDIEICERLVIRL